MGSRLTGPGAAAVDRPGRDGGRPPLVRRRLTGPWCRGGRPAPMRTPVRPSLSALVCYAGGACGIRCGRPPRSPTRHLATWCVRRKGHAGVRTRSSSVSLEPACGASRRRRVSTIPINRGGRARSRPPRSPRPTPRSCRGALLRPGTIRVHPPRGYRSAAARRVVRAGGPLTLGLRPRRLRSPNLKDVRDPTVRPDAPTTRTAARPAPRSRDARPAR